MAHINVVDGEVVDGPARLELRALADFGYEVLQRPGMFELDNAEWLERCDGAALLVCLSPTVERLYGERIRRFFAAHRPAGVRYLTLRTTEAHKTMETALAICEAAREARLDRHGMLVAIGGGIALDLVGFAASIYRRGIRYVKIPTTLVGQVDVAVGLKTGVNALGGKNLLGTYYPAHLTVNDPEFLRTLPAREVRCGLAEILKMGLVCDAEIFTALEALRPNAAGHPEASPELVHLAMLRMMEELQPNLFETNLARLVDFGHTFSMRVETVSQYAYAHGEAVAIDIALSSCISHQLGMLSSAEVGRIFGLLARCGLRAFDAAVCSFDDAWEALLDAQLHRGNRINLVVPAQIGEGVFVRALDQLPAAVLERALRQAAALALPGDPGRTTPHPNALSV
jgi:2-epi-5-epi-valiolone synthase